jgi:hypothetical protein
MGSPKDLVGLGLALGYDHHTGAFEKGSCSSYCNGKQK